MVTPGFLECPGWCTESHDHRELMFQEADHTAAFLDDPGGAFVALHQLDAADSATGPMVLCAPADGGRLARLEAAAARRFAEAVLAACDAAEHARQPASRAVA